MPHHHYPHHPPTRSHLRLYTPLPTTSITTTKHPSSTIFPLHPPAPITATYAIRHNIASDSESVGLVAGRLWTDDELRTPEPPATHGPTKDAGRQDNGNGNGGGGGDGDGNGNGAGKGAGTEEKGVEEEEEDVDKMNILDEIRRQRKKEQEELDLTSPALLLLHVYPTGSTFLEAPPPAPDSPTTITMLRLAHGHTTAPPHRQPTTIPVSHRPNHILIPLDSDCQILLTTNKHTHKLLYQTVEMSIAVPSTSENNSGVEIYSTGREYTGDEDYHEQGGEDNESKEKEEGEGREVEGGLSTPPPGLGGKEVTRVLDTPHGHEKQKSNFGDGRSLLEETQDESMFAGFEPTPDETVRRLFNDHGEGNKPRAGEHMVVDDDETGDEDEDFILTMPADPATLPRSDTSGVSAPVSFIGTLPPSSGGGGMSSPVGSLLIAKTTPPREGEDIAGEEELSESLPEAFKVAQEIKNLAHKPPGLKTYGHRRGPAGHGKKQEKVEVEQKDRKWTQELELTPVPKSSPPLRTLEGNGNTKTKGSEKRKSKIQEKEIKESSQIAVEEEMQVEELASESMDADGEEIEKEPEASPTVGRRPRLKRPPREATTAAPIATPGKRKRGSAKKVEEAVGSGDDDDARLEDEVEEEFVIEVKSARKSNSKQKQNDNEKKENKKPPKKKARANGEAKKEDKGENTQYTFYGSEEEEEAEGNASEQEVEKEESPPPFKTPAKRGRKSTTVTSTMNTPARPPPSTSMSTSPNHAPKTTSLYSGPTPKIVFSNSSFPDRKDATNILRTLSVKKAQKVTEKGVTHLVVGSGGLVRSSKLALALTLGLPIITDSWLLDSYNSPQAILLDPKYYIPSDPAAEQNWGFDLPSAIARGKAGQLSSLLQGYEVIYLTPVLVAHLKASNQEAGFMDILKATGAGKVLKRAPKGSMREEGVEKALVFGAGEGEKEGEVARWKVGGWGVFRVEMLTMSILRGRLEVDGEFGIVVGEGEEKGVRSQVSEKGVKSQGSEKEGPTPGKMRGGRRKSGLGK